MLSDIAISQQSLLQPVDKIASSLGLNAEDIETYGRYKAKISYAALNRINNLSRSSGKLILVTAITPTAAGEGKTTVSIGLGDALHLIGQKTIIALREPSLGPCFGRKGGATGGGYAQIAPMEDINLHFTGDIHAITVANNLLASVIDNHLYQGNNLQLNPQKIFWRRCVDLNDRVLRQIHIGEGAEINGIAREDGFDISVASEIMAVLCLSRNIKELKQRLGNIIVGQTYDGRLVKVEELKVVGAMAAVLKDALKPNLVQTLEQTPVFVHGGPFANIAHGCSSLLATQTALKLADYVVTEAGFGADLGAEKFMDIKCRIGNLTPATVVLVATVRALKMHGGCQVADLSAENLSALECGFANLEAHITNLQKFGVPVIVALNRFKSDTDNEIAYLIQAVAKLGLKVFEVDCWGQGGHGAVKLAHEVVSQASSPANFHYLYADNMPLIDKITTIAKEIYHASEVQFSTRALDKLELYSRNGYADLPVCIAKTQNSISHDKNLLGAPHGYTLPINDVRISAGAGFVVALTSGILTMPGLPRVPAAENIDVDDNGVISGLF